MAPPGAFLRSGSSRATHHGCACLIGAVCAPGSHDPRTLPALTSSHPPCVPGWESHTPYWAPSEATPRATTAEHRASFPIRRRSSRACAQGTELQLPCGAMEGVRSALESVRPPTTER
ncbi:hypothetical protein BD311DRAFT_175901 [Dichomitus squalens]|uniref:Uncharacterized protein n=1 Tax=Dichomitus squalens TaxID=114155 RepID=A0A4Q9MSP2_9APHY|nr:hypothetical protein BD311DRAFT_175901 [Dichomitus squalens]